MKVRELMNYLNENYDPDDALIVAWWEKTHVGADDLTPEQWVDAADQMETNRFVDWSYIQEQIEGSLAAYLEN